jgi:hypothetical protein
MADRMIYAVLFCRVGGVAWCSLRWARAEAAGLSGQEAAGVPRVDLAHAVWVWWGVRAERGADVSHEGQ